MSAVLRLVAVFVGFLFWALLIPSRSSKRTACGVMVKFWDWKPKGAVLCIPHQPTADQMKTPVQSVENPKGLGGVIIYDQETLTMDSHNLVAVCDDRGDRGKNLPQTSSVVTTGEAKNEKCLTRL